jgi:hypothetical protein
VTVIKREIAEKTELLQATTDDSDRARLEEDLQLLDVDLAIEEENVAKQR